MGVRIARMDFSPWGCFEDHSLAFIAEPGQVDLIYGPNASGKSTTSRGERSLLYGIDPRTPDNHTYDYADLRIGASLQLDGTLVELSRRKRHGKSLLGEDGAPVPEELIQKALGGLTEEVYRALFQVNHDTLVQGGAELLQGQGEIGASLFAAAAGIATLHDTLAGLDSEADRLFSPRARTTVLHKALANLRDAEKRMREATLRPARHREMTRALADTQERLDSLTAQMREIDLEMRVLERRRAVAPLLAARARRTTELDALSDTPDLAESAPTERSDAQGRLRAGGAALERARSTVERLAVEIDATEVDGDLLARGDEIRIVKESVSAITKARSDRRKREGELQETEAALRAAAAVIGVEDFVEIESLTRPASARRALDRQLSERDELTSRQGSAERTAGQAERGVEDAEADLQAVTVAVNVQPLAAAITSALKGGVLSEQIEKSQMDATLRAAEAEERLARLNPPVASINALRGIRAPSGEHVARACAETQAMTRAREDLESGDRRLAEAEADLAEERDRIALIGEAPTAEALAHAREGRDEQWVAIRYAAVSGEPVGIADAEGFQRAITAADHLADGRADHAAQIERTAAAQARARGLERERSAVVERQRDLDQRQSDLSADWETAWAVTGLTVVSAEDAVAWLQERGEILALDRAGAELQAHAEMLSAREHGHGAALLAELRNLGEEVTGDAPLDTLLARGQDVVARAQTQATSRSGLEATLVSAQRTLAAATREQAEATSAAKEWQDLWPQRRTDAGLPSTATPDAAQEIVRAVEDGLGQLRRMHDLERRIAGIDADQAEFEADVSRLREDVAPDLAALQAEQAAAALHRKLAETERSAERRDGLIEQQADAGKELAAIESDMAAAESEIAALIAAAGADSAEELPDIERRSHAARTLRDEVAELDRQIAEVGDGNFTEFSDDSVDFDRDRAAVELQGMRERLDDLRLQRDDAKEQIGDRKRELASAESDTTAVQAAQDVALARAAVTEIATQYSRAKLASAVVRRAIERYRSLHQDPLLDRANQLFTRFTLGSFVELFVDLDDRGRGVLIGRERNRVLKQVPAMSKGTREQLFLALRIAAIERYVSTVAPVPVLFDDVFIESDEPRSERVFEALGELAGKTQVIVLTHHRHLVEVGRRALHDDLLVQDLPDAAPTLREAVAAA
jgi:uncharacterized protein YhaN